MHRLQTLEGFEVEPIVSHKQIAAFHQRQPKVAGQVSVFEVGFVVRPRCQQHNSPVGHRDEGAHAAE